MPKKEKRMQSKRPSIKHIDIDAKKKHSEINGKGKNLHLPLMCMYDNNEVMLNGAL